MTLYQKYRCMKDGRKRYRVENPKNGDIRIIWADSLYHACGKFKNWIVTRYTMKDQIIDFLVKKGLTQ